MRQPIEVEMPARDSPGQIVACSVTLLRLLGWELGQKYDLYLRRRLGDTWLEDLRRRRERTGAGPMYRRRLNLYDPSFGLGEPLHHPDSPLRECLPSGREFYDLLAEVGQIRNEEQHFDRAPNLRGLREMAGLIRRLAVATALPMVDVCDAVVTRVEELGHGAVDEVVRSKELLADLESDRARVKQLAGEVADLRSRLRAETQRANDDAAAGDELRDLLMSELQDAEVARATAEEELRVMQAALEAQLANARSDHADVDDLDLRPGDAWPGSPPSRVLRLLPDVGDLYDPDAVDLLSNEVGVTAVTAAARWRQLLPHGGTVLMDDAGRAVSMIAAQWVFLGALDDA